MKHVYAVIYQDDFDLYSSYKKARDALYDCALRNETGVLNGDTLEVYGSLTGEYHAYISKRTIL